MTRIKSARKRMALFYWGFVLLGVLHFVLHSCKKHIKYGILRGRIDYSGSLDFPKKNEEPLIYNGSLQNAGGGTRTHKIFAKSVDSTWFVSLRVAFRVAYYR